MSTIPKGVKRFVADSETCVQTVTAIVNCTSGDRSISSSPGTILTLTGPLARTDAQRTAAVANIAISPKNCPSDRTATRYSRGPRDKFVAKSCAFDAPCKSHEYACNAHPSCLMTQQHKPSRVTVSVASLASSTATCCEESAWG